MPTFELRACLGVEYAHLHGNKRSISGLSSDRICHHRTRLSGGGDRRLTHEPPGVDDRGGSSAGMVAEASGALQTAGGTGGDGPYPRGADPGTISAA